MKIPYLLIVGILFLFVILMSPRQDEQKKIKYPEVKYAVTVKLKLLDVLVLDDDDKPVKNLMKDDFELYIDGKLRNIDTFDIKDYTARKVEEAKPSEKPEEIITEKVPEEKLNEYDEYYDKRLLFFVFNDLIAIKGRRKNLANGIYEFIDNNLTDRDLVSIYYMHGSLFILLLPFTNDREEIKFYINDFLIENKIHLKFLFPEISFIPRKLPGRFSGAGYLEDLKAKNEIEMKINEYINAVSSFNVFLKSLSIFKGRKEILIFSESYPVSYYANSTRFWNFRKLIDDAKNNNIVINTFDLRPYRDVYRSQVNRIIDWETDIKDEISSGTLESHLKQKLNEYLIGLAGDTDGLFFLRCSSTNLVSNNMKKVYDRSSYVYYLGSYIQDLAEKEKHDVKIKVRRDDVKVVYHDSFRAVDSYLKMDAVDRQIQILEVLHGSVSFDDFPFQSNVLQFPFNNKKTLVLTTLQPNAFKPSSNNYTAVVRYYNPETLNDDQRFSNWDIWEPTEGKTIRNLSFIMAGLVEDGEYYSHCILRDYDTGDLSNKRGRLRLGLNNKLLSSIVLFAENPDTLTLTNLADQEKSFDKENKEELIPVFDPELNPFLYKDRLLFPVVNRTIRKDKPAFLMSMYNVKQIIDSGYNLEYSLLGLDGNKIDCKISNAALEMNFPNGWRRVTLKLPLVEIPLDINELKFVVIVKDQAGKEIESESTYIKIK